MSRKQDSERGPGRHDWRGWLRYSCYSAAVLLLLAGAMFLYARMDLLLASDPRFTLAEPSADGDSTALQIAGALHTPRAAILRVFATDFGRSVYLLPLEKRRRALLEIDWVRDASVSRLWPDRLAVHIVERKPVAFIRLPSAVNPASSSVALVDAEGVILIPPERAEFTLPAISGIRREQNPSMRRQRVAIALRLVSELGSLAGQLSEIDVSDPENVQVVQQASGRVVTLQLGNRNFLSRIQNFLRYFEAMEQQRPEAAAFDLRLDDRITVVGEGTRGG
jgi:cell division protein FtsQ